MKNNLDRFVLEDAKETTPVKISEKTKKKLLNKIALIEQKQKLIEERHDRK